MPFVNPTTVPLACMKECVALTSAMANPGLHDSLTSIIVNKCKPSPLSEATWPSTRTHLFSSLTGGQRLIFTRVSMAVNPAPKIGSPVGPSAAPLPFSLQTSQDVSNIQEESNKRKKPPRKLDSEKCQLCRQHKLKCLPQPRTWPQKCDRCLSKGLECSPGEVKKRTRRRAPGEEEPESMMSIASDRRSHGQDHDGSSTSWNCEDLMDILTAVQLLNSVYEVHHHQRTSLLDILDFQKTPCQSNGPGTQAQLDVPYVSGLHQTLPLLKDRISIALKTRLGHGKTTCLAERMLFENTLTELHSNLPKRPIIDGPVEPHKLLIREQISDLMFRSRSSMSEIITLKAIVSLSTTLSSRLPILLKKFDLYDWSYVEQGFGPEWEKLVPHAVVGCLLFAPGDLYSDSQPYAKIWAHDILVKEGAKYPILARDLALIPPRIRNWSLKELAFLTDHVGPDLKDNQGLTLVHAAILDRRPDIVHQLLEPGGAKPWHRIFRRRFSLFHFAASVGCESCYAELRCHPEIRPAEETRDRNGMLPLHVAALRGQVNVVEAILKAHFDGAEGNEEYVNRETSEAGHTALYLAIARAEDDATARFLAMYPGVDFLVDRQVRQTALHVAASRKRHGLLRFLLCRAPEHQLNVQNEDGETALHIIARHGDRETLNAVLDLPSIELDVTANDGSTPLVDAVTNGNMVAMEALIGCPGVDITALRRPLEPFGFSALEHILQEANGNDGSGGYVDILECLRVRCPELEDDLYEASMAEMETDDGDMEVE
ncbi:ankyrin-2 ankyrin [Colletotrichum scovillei]|uniref:ankyrin-2 ankyrin n=1 Tax=Colletotrichum scovillei TaxID=1209932 RepID=UPI0015C3CF29|nr:ankyrin-2 ankyrin [Colletotrichum scovillei]KAF4775370.1 ankyrin-2 ankyrin [Colletotrichum scovillei]